MVLRWSIAFLVGVVWGALWGWPQGWAAKTPVEFHEQQIFSQIKNALAEKYPGAKIEVGENVSWVRGKAPQNPGLVRLLEETPRGEAKIAVVDLENNEYGEGLVQVSAWVPAWIAKRRVLPGERLNPENFIVRSVNLTLPHVRDIRGLILTATQAIDTLEARQTILEGQFILSNAVHKMPDVRRGDPITLRLQHQGITLSAQAVAEEPANLNERIRVMTLKSKRSLTGLLTEKGVVEVGL